MKRGKGKDVAPEPLAADADNVKDLRMLFVRGIASNIDETSLSESFSSLGPVSQVSFRDDGHWTLDFEPYLTLCKVGCCSSFVLHELGYDYFFLCGM